MELSPPGRLAMCFLLNKVDLIAREEIGPDQSMAR
jgi:hypothetical protein